MKVKNRWILVIILALILTLFGQQTTIHVVESKTNTTSEVFYDNISLPSLVPILGEQRIIVILVEFEDIKHSVTGEIIYNRVFKEMADYYNEVSYGLVSISGDITNWNTLPAPYSSYADLDSWENWSIKLKLIRDAIKAADKDIDFRKYKYVFVVHPAPVRWAWGGLKPNILTDDNVVVNNVSILSERHKWWTFAHEFGHNLGLPDLYDHAKAKEGTRDWNIVAHYTGRWCLMSWDLGQHMCGWAKMKLGWISSERIKSIWLGQVESIIIAPLEQITKEIQLIRIFVGAPPYPTPQYYLIEVRQRIGFDSKLPDSGVLITLIDETKRTGMGIVSVLDSSPVTSYLDDAPFGLPPKNPLFVDGTYNIGILVTEQVGLSYKIKIAPPTVIKVDFAELKQQEQKTKVAIADAKEAWSLAYTEIRTEGLDEAKAMLDKASALYQSGNYEEAFTLANEAKIMAQKAQRPRVYYEAEIAINKAKMNLEKARAFKLRSKEAPALLREADTKYNTALNFFSYRFFELAKQEAHTALNFIDQALAAEHAYKMRVLLITSLALGGILLLGGVLFYFYWKRRGVPKS